jgi:hypothetical protein
MSLFYAGSRAPYRAAVLFGALLLSAAGFSQTVDAPTTPPPASASVEVRPNTADVKSNELDHRILGVIPNYRTANPTAVYVPLATTQKFTIAMKDSFDWPNYLVAGAFAGLHQLDNENPSFGQGVKGYAHRYWTAYLDQSLGNLMSEATLPSLLHEDPRYFRKVTGSNWSRVGYALTRVLITRTDAGGKRFNFSEVVGNGIVAGIGNAYYVDNRGFSDTASRWTTQVATDAFSNVLKEFWPDIKRWWVRRHDRAGN